MVVKTLPSAQLGRVLAGRYTLEKTIGKGSFGAVLRALDRANSATVAVKVQQKHVKDTTMELRQRREQHLHSIVSQHPNVVSFLNSFETNDAACMVLQFVPAGDLCTAIENRAYYGDSALITHCFAQLLDAVAFCHARGVYHRDLKPENVLVSGDRRTWYLTDFGLATPNAFSSSAGIGTQCYMAPEVVGSPEFSRAVIKNASADVWSLGMTLLAVVLGGIPWARAERKDKKFAQYVASPQPYLVRTCPISSSFAILLADALAVDDAKRITPTVFKARLTAIRSLYNATVKERITPSWLAEEDTPAVWANQVPKVSHRPQEVRAPSPQPICAPSPNRPAVPPIPQLRRNNLLVVPVPQARAVRVRSPTPTGPRSLSSRCSPSPIGLPAPPTAAAPRKASPSPTPTPSQSPVRSTMPQPPIPVAPVCAPAAFLPPPPMQLPFFVDYYRAPSIKYHDIPAVYLDIAEYLRAPSADDTYIPPPAAAPPPRPMPARPTLAPIVTRLAPPPPIMPPTSGFITPPAVDDYHPLLDVADYLRAPSPTAYVPSPAASTAAPAWTRFPPLPPLPTPPLIRNVSTNESAMPVTPGVERGMPDMRPPVLEQESKQARKDRVLAEAKRALCAPRRDALAVPQGNTLVVPEGAKQRLRMLGAQQARVIGPRAATVVRRVPVQVAVPLKVDVEVC